MSDTMLRRPRGTLRSLSDRQLEIERLIDEGLKLREIARRLGMSTTSVQRARDAIEDFRTVELMRSSS